ncbi:hypothetical protein ACRRTK_009833 [Alexandromys fortis]
MEVGIPATVKDRQGNSDWTPYSMDLATETKEARLWRAGTFLCQFLPSLGYSSCRFTFQNELTSAQTQEN